jgi:hypothetical protein
MKRLLQQALLWVLGLIGWEVPVKTEVLRTEVFVRRPKVFSGNAHQRRIMLRAQKQAYGK